MVCEFLSPTGSYGVAALPPATSTPGCIPLMITLMSYSAGHEAKPLPPPEARTPRMCRFILALCPQVYPQRFAPFQVTTNASGSLAAFRPGDGFYPSKSKRIRRHQPAR
jgi:hypothetical protein